MTSSIDNEILSYDTDDDGVAVSGDALRITVYPDPTGLVGLHLAAPMSEGDERMADYTPRYEYSGTVFQPSEIRIDDDGTLTAMHAQGGAAAVDIRWGLSVRLPPAYVAPVRTALATVIGRIEQAGATGD